MNASRRMSNEHSTIPKIDTTKTMTSCVSVNAARDANEDPYNNKIEAKIRL